MVMYYLHLMKSKSFLSLPHQKIAEKQKQHKPKQNKIQTICEMKWEGKRTESEKETSQFDSKEM